MSVVVDVGRFWCSLVGIQDIVRMTSDGVVVQARGGQEMFLIQELRAMSCVETSFPTMMVTYGRHIVGIQVQVQTHLSLDRIEGQPNRCLLNSDVVTTELMEVVVTLLTSFVVSSAVHGQVSQIDAQAW